jgi:hypothetical protein
MKKIALLILFSFVFTSFVQSQIIPDRNEGNILYSQEGIMDGNLVRTLFTNYGMIAHWPNQPSGEWPKGSGHSYVDGVAIIAQSEVNYNGHVFHPLETRYREFMRHAPDGTPWGWEPLPGYSNPNQSSPAISTDKTTWPNHWGDRPADWDGYWDGFFGKGVQNADLESFFVFDDASDKQYTSLYGYYPIPSDTTRGGLGIQVKGRGFQWSQVLAQDNIFWYYELQNISQHNYPKTLFAQYVDWGIGGVGGSDFNSGAFDTLLDISYAWSEQNYGQPGNWSPVGVAGYAFLQSPGNSTDHKDNDYDGLTDESQDNDAMIYVTDPSQDYFFTDSVAFKRFYNQSWHPHWLGDENENWVSYTDLNHDGKWEPNEPLNDDVGSDGIGPLDPGYPGPDPDGTQGNGRPDQGEPDFGRLDKDESDQLGLTGYNIFPVHQYELLDDEQNWQVLTALEPPSEQILKGVNLANMFACGLFPFNQNDIERFSMALLFGNDAQDLARRKQTIQQIYNANYQFFKPPNKPILTAVPGDRKVTLYWDDGAEKTYDRFLQQYDFEGYKIYRATDPSFLESQVITDAFGNPTFRKPIAQFDKVDGIKGFFPFAVNGTEFYLGDDSGLRHSYVDSTVQNGQTYYYAVVSYNYGYVTTNVLGQVLGISPAECTSNIKVDANGNVKFSDVNTAVVVPGAPSAGFVPAGVVGNIQHNGPGTGYISLSVLNSNLVKNGHTYQLTFQNNGRYNDSTVSLYGLSDLTSNATLDENVPVTTYGQELPVFDGIIGYIYNDTVISINKSGWIKGNSNYIVITGLDKQFATTNVSYPADFQIEFYDHIVDTSQHLYFGSPVAKPVNFTVWNVTENSKADFLFFDNNNNGLFDAGDEIVIVYGDSAGSYPVPGRYHTSWSIKFVADTTKSIQVAPSAGDIFQISTKKPFRNGESFTFTMRGETIDTSQARNDLSKIQVVPNPYLGAVSWEPPLLFQTGRGERRIYFTHLPKVCTIRIYTVRGFLVQEIQHNAPADDGQEPWNLQSKDGMDIAYGLYIYQVDAPGIGTKIGKFAVIK